MKRGVNWVLGFLNWYSKLQPKYSYILDSKKFLLYNTVIIWYKFEID